MEKLRMYVLGIRRLEGKAKATGNNYDITRLLVAKPIDMKRHKNGVVEGFGYEQVEHECEAAVLDQLRSAKLPAEANVTVRVGTDQRGQLSTIVVGCEVDKLEKGKAA